MTGRILAGGLLLLLAAGCERPTGTLSGRVTYDGKPVMSGLVTVVDSDGVPHGATIQADGTYQVNDIPAGPVRIAVDSPDPRAGRSVSGEGESAPQPKATDWRPIPERYADASTSGVTFELKRGPNTFNIDMSP